MQLAGSGLRPRTFPCHPMPVVLARTRRFDPRRFGRATVARSHELPVPAPTLMPSPAPARPAFGSELKLFLMTFLAGFLFVSILLA